MHTRNNRVCMALLITHISYCSNMLAVNIIKPIFNNNPIINAPGFYKLAENITIPITITANNVRLDLNDYRVSNTSADAISISANFSDITIFNGEIGPVSGNGIKINTGCSNIVMHHLHIRNCTTGILATNSSLLLVNNSLLTANSNEGMRFDSCTNSFLDTNSMSYNTVGIYLEQSNDIHIASCIAISNLQAGYQLNGCHRCTHKQCHALLNGISNTTSSYGFRSTNGTNNIFERCISKDTTTLATGKNNIAAGFCCDGTESDTHIIGCTASNTTTPTNGQSSAYGITLRSVLAQPSLKISNNRGSTVQTINAFTEYPLFATGGAATSNNRIELHKYDAFHNTVETVAAIAAASGASNVLVSSPNNIFLAAGGSVSTSLGDTQIYELSPAYETLIYRTSALHGATIRGLAWHPSNRFLITAGDSALLTGEVRLYEFDPTAITLVAVQTLNIGAAMQSVSWSPNGKYVAIGGIASGGFQLRLYEFNIVTKSLTLRDSKNRGATTYSVAWAPNGLFLAAGGDADASSKSIALYELNTSTKLLTLTHTEAHGATIRSLSWSPEGNYLAAGGATAGDGKEIRIYEADYTTKTLSIIYSIARGDTIFSLFWAQNGQLLYAGGNTCSSLTHYIYEVMQCPQRCLLQGNSTYGNHGGTYATSAGISAPSSTNYVMKNISFNNDTNYFYSNAVYHGDINQYPGNFKNLAVE